MKPACLQSVLSEQQPGPLLYTCIYNPNHGFKAEEVIGKTDADLLPEPEAALLIALKRQVLKSGTSVRQNVQVTIDGNACVFDLSIEPLRDAAGAVVGLIGASLDVTGQQGAARGQAIKKGSTT